MVRKAIISVLTAALALAGSVLGTAGVASAAAPSPASVARPTSPAFPPDDYQANAGWLADSLAEGVKLHGRKNLRKNNRLWQHGPTPGPGWAHIVIRLKSGAVLGVNDVQFGDETTGFAHQFYLALPNARKLLKKRKHAVIIDEVTFHSTSGAVVTAARSTRL